MNYDLVTPIVRYYLLHDNLKIETYCSVVYVAFSRDEKRRQRIIWRNVNYSIQGESTSLRLYVVLFENWHLFACFVKNGTSFNQTFRRLAVY